MTFIGCTIMVDYYCWGVWGPVFFICIGCHNEYGLAIEELWKSLLMWYIDDWIDDGIVVNILVTFSLLVFKIMFIGNDEMMFVLLVKF